MIHRPDPSPGAAGRYSVDAAQEPDEAWRVVAAHHLLTSRHHPDATMSIAGIGETCAHNLRNYANRLGLSGLRIPSQGTSDSDPMIVFGPGSTHWLRTEPIVSVHASSTLMPSELCEVIAILIEAAGPRG